MAATVREVRRAIGRAERGVAIDHGEAVALLAARGQDLFRLQEVAAAIRDQGLSARGHGSVITYSPKVFVPLTKLCRDSCRYCTFATDPAALRDSGQDMFLEPDAVMAIVRAGAAGGALEALFTLGDRPEARWLAARQWLDARGFDDTLSYVRAMSIQVLEETGLLPHLNPGVMSWDELVRMRRVAPSMGMMLESVSDRLWSSPDGPHYGSVDKNPAVRLRVLEDAGRLAIPFTTGVLVGIGETPAERIDSLFAIRSVGREYGHIQEVIIQNFRAKSGTAMASVEDLDFEAYLATIATSRVLLGSKLRIQAPPNLSDPGQLAALIAAGVDDWGGISTVTVDHVNPERPWPAIDALATVTAAAGFELRARLGVHSEYVSDPVAWIDSALAPHVRALAAPAGLADPDAVPTGLAWQQPESSYQDFIDRDEASGTGGMIDLTATNARSGERGDGKDSADAWAQIARRADRAEFAVATPAAASATARMDSHVRAALDLAASDPAALADPANEAAAVALMSCEGQALKDLADIADA
ncbi:MAG: 7,8-didemethyl-8-hydroxy-5-deazariboflavin synthase CofG, partial [Actinomycetes bacterium]